MKELLRKIGLLGVGVISLTQEKIEAFVDELVKRGELNKEEGRKLVQEMLEEKNKQLQQLEEKITSKVQEAIDKAGLARKTEIEELKKRISKLEETLE